MLTELMEVILYVPDMAEAVGFYRDQLGLRIAHPDCNDYASEHWVVFETGACKLCLHAGGSRRQGPDCPKIVFHVEDIHKARGDLMARGVQLSEVRSPSPGVFVADGFDPAGNPFSIEQA